MRVAVYATPEVGQADPRAAALLERAETWLGRSAAGDPVAPWPDVPRRGPGAGRWTRADVDAITADSRRYGFHATLKAPFRLAEGRTLAALERDLTAFAAEQAPVEIPGPAIARIDGFFALVPAAPVEALSALAARIVREFDRYRAAFTQAELERRRRSPLTPHQEDLLLRWGYPYVLDEFRFHCTLTDPIPPDRQGEVEAVLTEWFADCLGPGLRLDRLAVFIEREPGALFELHSTHPLLASVPDEPAPSRETTADEQ